MSIKRHLIKQRYQGQRNTTESTTSAPTWCAGMARVMLVAPWNYHNEKVKIHDFSQEWHNAPYSLLLLGTILKTKGHEVTLVDLDRDLINWRGDVNAILAKFSEAIGVFRPDVIAFSFFSVH